MTPSRGATVAEANSLRQRILTHPDLPPRDVARLLGCALSTVYKVRADPAADRRARPLPRRAPDSSAEPLKPAPSGADPLATLTTPWIPIPAGADPYGALAFDGFAAAARLDPTSLAGEIALLRAQVLQAALQLQQPGLATPQIVALQDHLSRLAERLARLVRVHAATSHGANPVLDALTRLVDEARRTQEAQ